MVWGIVLSLVFAFAWRSMAAEQGGILAERLAGIDVNHTPWIFSWSPATDWQAVSVTQRADGQRVATPVTSWQMAHQSAPGAVLTQHNDNSRTVRLTQHMLLAFLQEIAYLSMQFVGVVSPIPVDFPMGTVAQGCFCDTHMQGL